MDYHLHARLEFGEYVHTHERHGNDTQPRTVGAIALHPNGRQLLRNRWAVLPLPADIIRRVDQLARRNPKGLTFSDHSGNPLMSQDDDDEDPETDDYAEPPELQDGGANKGYEDTDNDEPPELLERNSNDDNED
eukprot:5251583-Ditylum_brightwellii.AAC.1